MPDSLRRVFIASVPFGQVDRTPLRLLEEAGVEFAFKPEARRYSEDEIARELDGFGVVIAGLDPLTERVLARVPQLRLISRTGIGLDTVDLDAARARGIAVAYTPEAPAAAVAELTIGLMLALLRSIPRADREIRAGGWPRLVGRRLGDLTVGIVAAGRIGRRVIRHLAAFDANILVTDRHPDRSFGNRYGVRWVDFDELLRESDLVSLHVPLSADTKGMIGAAELARMKSDAMLVNTARGELVDEAALVDALRSGRLGGAALDVFAAEPYSGALASLDNVVLTSHLGSMSADCRARMEREAVEDVLRFLRGEPLQYPAPVPEPPAARA